MHSGREGGGGEEEEERNGKRHIPLYPPPLCCLNLCKYVRFDRHVARFIFLLFFFLLALRIRLVGRSLAITISLLNVPNLCSHLLQQHLGACSPPPFPPLSLSARILKLFRQKSNELERHWQQLLQLGNNNKNNEPLPCLLLPTTHSPPSCLSLSGIYSSF